MVKEAWVVWVERWVRHSGRRGTKADAKLCVPRAERGMDVETLAPC